MKVIIRDITIHVEKEINLPVDNIYNFINKEHEYIIVGNDPILDIREYDSIIEINDFLIECQKNDISTETLSILSRIYTAKEVMQIIRSNQYIIVNFTEETKTWNYNTGGDIHDDDDKGRLLHDYGMSFSWEKTTKITQEMMDDIRWGKLWEEAESIGWESVRCYSNDYLIWTKM